MKPPLLLLFALLLACVILGVASLHNAVLALTIPLMAYLFAAIWQRPDDVRLMIRHEITPDQAPQGTPLTVKVTLINQGAAIDELELRDLLPAGVRQLDGYSSALVHLEPQGEIALEYTIEAQRGAYDIYEASVQVRDFLSFFEHPLIYRTAPRFVAHPHYPKLDRVRIRPPQTRGFAGPIGARQGGTGIDFWSVREYQSGDPQRQINWRLAARSYNDLYTNVFEQERVADVGLILDARQRVNVVTTTGSLFENSVRAVAALSENFLNEGNRVSLLIYGSEMRRVFPGYGRRHQNRILTALSRARPGINYALESLAYLPTRLFPAQSQIVIVSPLSPDDLEAVIQMRARGYAVIVVSPDPIAYEATLYHDTSSTAYRLAHAEREFILRQMRRSAIQIVNWQVDQPLEVVVRETLTRQPAALHINRLGAL